MIPSNMLDRMVVYKSGAADLPGEFAGGIIRVFTKKAPEENFFNIGITTGYRASTTFQNAPTTGSGKLDFLGFDNGDRAIPDRVPGATQRFNNLPSAQRAELINQLPNRWAVNYRNASPDLRINVNLGRRFDLGGLRIGNLTGVNYSNTNQYADVELNSYTNGETQGELEVRSNDQQFANNARLGILHNWLFRFNPNFSIEFKNLFNQLGSNETVVRNATDFVEGRPIALYSQRFESRSIYTGQLIGNNTLGEGRTDIDWRLGYAYTHRTEPDWRRVRYVDEPLTAAISNQPVLINAGRFFSELNENVFTAGGDVEHKLGDLAAEDAIKLKAGFYAERKDRDFDARFFGYTNGDTTRKRLPVDQIFSPENVTGRDLSAFSVQEEYNPSNRYDAANTLLAGYAQAYVPFGRFNATVGLRMEYNRQELNSRNRGGNRINVDNPVVSPLPSVNIAYNLSDKQLVRVAYAYTVNRPEFRELAPFRYYDFNINADIEGNEFLETAQIHNADVRWEYYPSPSELVSFGVFYKYFNKPIESYLRTQPGAISYTFVNADNATSYGAEIEIRKSFSELSQSRFFQSLSVVANASYIFSNIDMGPSVRVGSAVSSTPLPVSGLVDRNRPMQNQSPYLVNGGLYYSDEKAGLQVNVLYNVFGKRVFAVGSLEEPTIYEMPRSVVDFNITKNIGPKLEVRFSAQDILNQAFRLEQDYNNDAKIEGGADGNQVIRSFRRGQYFTVGINYNFNRKSLTPTTN
jgi:hypothetical protein